MKLLIYKGFDEDFYKTINHMPLLEISFAEMKNVLSFTKDLKRKLSAAVLGMGEDDVCWITYEEFSLIKDNVILSKKDYGLGVVVIVNNLYPEYYPISFDMEDDLVAEINNVINSSNESQESEQCAAFMAIYNALINIDGTYFSSFYNYEYDKDLGFDIEEYYAYDVIDIQDPTAAELSVFVNDDIETYLRVLSNINVKKPKVISIKTSRGHVSERIINSLKAYCAYNDISLVKDSEEIVALEEKEQALADIAKNAIGIPDFKDFRKIKFYKNPDINNEVVEIKQSQIISDIITQAEAAYESDGKDFRDIFITASTGAGKSVMFQTPAIYLAQKYNKLTIIIEPVKALMQDQKEQLNARGYNRVETFNSDLISQAEKEAVLKRVKEGAVDLLYLSPETLLSYSIDTLIGDREIGLLIVDEAHIVTTWGVGFRPDYWYLGGYINNIRNVIKAKKRTFGRIQHFPICAFTATAVNGGEDDSVSETIISLYMENPIKYIGYVKRDNIKFDINVVNSKKLPNTEYELQKGRAFAKRVEQWNTCSDKTITYFPYATYANDAYKGLKGFVDMPNDISKISIYVGRNIGGQSTKSFASDKKAAFEKFRSGEHSIMFATKAFGMGVDINDIKNVYHYAVTGNLSDYVQEIGRAARNPKMTGYAITDYFYNDIIFMQRLFGMSQIRQYQIKLVLSGIYNIFRSKQERRNFLISPESFTYIFNEKDEKASINKLKTCLLMLEKDFYDKFNFKVLIARPQSVFTKAYVVIKKENEAEVLSSKYGDCFKYIAGGRDKEWSKNIQITDVGDIFLIDLKTIWEKYYQNISFPQFKYWYFNSRSTSPDKVYIMPEIQDYIYPRQHLNIEANGDYKLNQVRDLLLDDLNYIADVLYFNFKKTYFTTQDFANVISERYGKTKAKIIANAIFDLIDPNGKCVKHRIHSESIGKTFMLSNGTFKEMMRKPITKSNIMSQISNVNGQKYSKFSAMLSAEDANSVTLKLLSIFGYITYELVGGAEPEIFIRINDPEKIRRIVMVEQKYSNDYVTRARKKHERDVYVLRKFFTDLSTNDERWDFIEEYFLGHNLVDENVASSIF